MVPAQNAGDCGHRAEYPLPGREHLVDVAPRVVEVLRRQDHTPYLVADFASEVNDGCLGIRAAGVTHFGLA
jgi:hypothetical protein